MTLKEGPGWTVQGSGAEPTPAQFQSVLADLQEILIRAEYRAGPDTDRIDNVALAAPDPAATLAEGLSAPAGDVSELAENPDGSFTRTLKNGTRKEFDSAGLMTAVVDRNGNTTRYA